MQNAILVWEYIFFLLQISKTASIKEQINLEDLSKWIQELKSLKAIFYKIIENFNVVQKTFQMKPKDFTAQRSASCRSTIQNLTTFISCECVILRVRRNLVIVYINGITSYTCGNVLKSHQSYADVHNVFTNEWTNEIFIRYHCVHLSVLYLKVRLKGSWYLSICEASSGLMKEFHSISFRITDIGGSAFCRRKWKNFYANTSLLIFVVDLAKFGKKSTTRMSTVNFTSLYRKNSFSKKTLYRQLAFPFSFSENFHLKILN